MTQILDEMSVVTEDRLRLFSEMEEKYEAKDADYFVNLITHDDFVIRTRATCILVDLGGEDKVEYVARVLKNDPNELVRHEAAFSLGQMGYSSGITHLEDATKNDPSMFVRHEAAIALGVIGSKEAIPTLTKALNDPDKPVVESAIVALSNIDFMDKLSKNEKFAKLTGG
ncbi:MAG TPA: HEAT repeat domain-containing protein [Nitrosopumilaceae archaeon]|nr:HEAT repeat domain-containing protein [Nitrosopumilaceae archaeon]